MILDVYLLVPIMYVIFFFFFIAVKSLNNTLDKLVFCPVCTSWFVVLILAFIFSFPAPLFSLMVGLSGTGISYKIIELKMNKDKKNTKISKKENIKYFYFFFILMLSVSIIGEIIVFLYSGGLNGV